MAHRAPPLAYLPDDRPVFEDDVPRMSLLRAAAELVAFGTIAAVLLLAILLLGPA